MSHPNSTIIQLKRPDLDQIAKEDMENDAFFPNFGSILVFDVLSTLKGLMKEHKLELVKYNKILKENKIPLRIRLTHTVTVSNRKYVYCGRYVYTTLPGNKREYKGKLDNIILRNELKDKYNKVGPPPDNSLEGLKYQIVQTGKRSTNHVIIPQNTFNNPKFHHLFKKQTHFRIA